MKRQFFLLVAILLVNLESFAALPLSPRAEISVITCEPGEEALFTVFGHSAIRVNDPLNNMDVAFNYGVFDFDQPNFYLNFAKGFLNYQLGVSDFSRFAYNYQYFDRTIYEQVLDLDSLQKQALFDFLANNAKPENKFYYYDYFYDNCATKIRDVLDVAMSGALQWDENYVKTGESFRDKVTYLTRNKKWGGFGIDLGLGLPMDKKMSAMEYMFLPEYVRDAVAKATLQTSTGTKPLVKQSKTFYQSQGKIEAKDTFFTPNVVFWSLFALILVATILGYIRKKYAKWLDIILFGVIGFVGVFLAVLWFATDHGAAARNMNLLWAIPTHFIAAIYLVKKNKPQWLSTYFLITAGLMVLLMIAWKFLPQVYNPAFFPIVLTLGLRAWWVRFNLRES